MYASPKRISISNIRSSSKNKELGSPSKNVQKQQEAGSNKLLIPPADNHQTPSKHLARKISNQSYRESVTKSQASQMGSDHPKKAKIILEYLQQLIRDIISNLSQAEQSKAVVIVKNLGSVQDFNAFAEQFFKAYNFYHKIYLQQELNQQLVIPLKYKQAKKVLFMEEPNNAQSKSSKNKKLMDLTKENEDLKKEVFKSRESIKELQKRLVFLIEEFKTRKTVYLKEIEKLISITETSIKGIPDLITLNKHLLNVGRGYLDIQTPIPNLDVKLQKKQTQYNTVFYNYNSNEGSIDPSSLQRYKSQGKIRTKQ